MGAFIDFLAGRNNKLLRDMLASSAVIAIACVVALTYVRSALDSIRTASQPLPPRMQAAQPPASGGQIITVTRSVLDDPVMTGSIGGRSVVLDPCTGKEKK